ncbi:hypothetical protein C1O54_06200 [Akkermansia muciniphila]|nr:hypothetical protein CUB89_03350 [Akkermansia muciniphila]QAA52811.1 hypothetical protein C1O50_06210 [Akkermansia muciniphila]QAA57436.1 hypothetical protein C1O54_06200 [Akkermansia muciniphila]QAA59749.1 hypothetical protein C1O57_06195 [Akkermansia muciniphila]
MMPHSPPEERTKSCFAAGFSPEYPETALMKRFRAEVNRPFREKQRSFLPQLFPEFYWELLPELIGK